MLTDRQKQVAWDALMAGPAPFINQFYAAVEAALAEHGADLNAKYAQGFEDCRAQAMNVVDEHDGFLQRIGFLEPTLLAGQARAAEQGQSKEWECFHCGEHFTSIGAAQDHFGATPEDQAACKIKVGEERGLVMSLRRAHRDREELWQIIDDIDTVSDAAKGDDAGYRRAVERMVQKRNVIAESPDGHKLNWKRDLLWDESAKVIREQPTQPPAGDVVERVMSRGCPISCSNDLGHSYTCLREHVAAALAVAREGYVNLEDAEDIVSTVIMPDPARELLIKRFRARLAKPAERVAIEQENDRTYHVLIGGDYVATFHTGPSTRDPKRDAERYAAGLREELKAGKQ